MSCLNVRLLRINTKLNASVFYKKEGFSAKVKLTCAMFPDSVQLYASDGKLYAQNTPLYLSEH